MDLAAGLVGLLAGLAVGPVADRLATNAPVGAPLLARAPFSKRLPLVAGATALLGAASGAVFGFTLEALVAAFFCWILVIVTRTDFEHRLIPDRIVLPGAVLVLVGRTVDEPSVAWILEGLGACLGLFLLVLVYPRGMGMGDVKLALFMGFGLGLTCGGDVHRVSRPRSPADRAARSARDGGTEDGIPSGRSSRSAPSSRSSPAMRSSTGTGISVRNH